MKIFVCVGTHWDREWYEPFQEFRRWLVDVVDEAMDIVEEQPGFRCFHFDGQAVVLEDYLAIRPERRERLIRLIKEGRINVGPWYDLPDLWLVSGESLVRNLQKGIQTCRDHGVEPMRFLFTPDQFGHNAAMPMISTGFGLKAGLCWRGTQIETHPTQFIWVGPDGSRQVTFKLPDMHGYTEFESAVRWPLWGKELTDETVREVFDPVLAGIREHSVVPAYLMLDGMDHQHPPMNALPIMDSLRRLYPDVEFIWASFDEFAEELVKHAGALPERSGELREVRRDTNRGGQYLIVHTLSSRYPNKRRNAQCQALLEKWAEPCALFEALDGGAPIPGYLDLAWKYLLKNHPHDSICGCSIDQVHRDMMYRFDQCENIGDGIIRRALARAGKASGSNEAQSRLVAVNPLPFQRKQVVELGLSFPPDWPEKHKDSLDAGEVVNKFYLQTRDGKRIPHQLLRIERGAVLRQLGEDSRNVPWRRGDLFHVAAEVTLPPCGLTGIEIVPTKDATRTFGSQLVGPLAASNGILSFALHSDGTGTLVHEPTGREFTDLFLYEDIGDCGDGWTRGVLSNDLMVRSAGSRVTCFVEENGPLRTVFRVERELDVPRAMDRRTYWRSEDRATLRIVDRYTLDKGSPLLAVHTTIQNTAMDHRLRVLMPTDVDARVSFADSPFSVVERPIAIPKEAACYEERINEEKPVTSFFGVQDDEGGLAVLTPFGPFEYAVLDTPERSLALTLFRSTFATVHTSGEMEGQLLQTLEFDYCLFPFGGPLDAQEVLQLVAARQAPVRAYTTRELPPDRSFLHLENDAVVVSALKPAQDGRGGVIRLWNPWETEVKEVIRLSAQIKRAALCNLNEEDQQDLRLDKKGGIPVTVPAKGLTTVRFEW